jgi:hypothetical protein
MTSINPFSGYVAQSAAVERTQATDKSRQVRRTQDLSKNVAARDDELEHQVESSDAVAAIHDEEHPQQQPQQQHGHPKPAEDDEEAPRLDITA